MKLRRNPNEHGRVSSLAVVSTRGASPTTLATARDLPEPVSRVAAPTETVPLSVRILDDPAELVRYIHAWEDLAACAVEANVFYEPWMLLPALEAFGAGEKLLFALVLEGDAQAAPEKARLCGFFPLQRRRLHRRLPLGVLSMWQHLHCYLCTPLVRAGSVHATLATLFDWLASDPRGASLVELNQILVDGPFAPALLECCQQRDNPAFVTESSVRALFQPRGDAEHYLRSVLSGKRRRALERRQRRLAETAPVEYSALERGEDVESWAEAFLRLEGQGWKGRSGTALGCDEANRGFFHAILRGAFERRRLLLCTLGVAGQPIAFRCSFLAGDGAFAFKTTYDEQYSDYAPGILLEMDHIRRLHDMPGVKWMDSCTAGDNRMMNDLYPERRTLHTVLAATGHGLGRPVVALYPWLRAVKRRLTRSADAPPPPHESDELEMPT